MCKKLLCVMFSALLMIGTMVQAFAAGATADSISSSPVSLFTVRYSNVTKSVRVDIVPSRDINVTIARAASQDETNAFKSAVSDTAAQNLALRSAEEYNDALSAAKRGYNEHFGIENYKKHIADNPDYLVEYKDYITNSIGEIGYENVLSGKYFDQIRFGGQDYHDTIGIYRFYAANFGDPSSAASDIDVIEANLGAAEDDLFNFFIKYPEAKNSAVALLGEKMTVNLGYSSGETKTNILNISPSTIDSIYNLDDKKPCYNVLEEVTTSSLNNEDAVITLTAGTRYAFSTELTKEELANAASITATLSTWELSEDGGYAEHTVTAQAEEQFVGISGIEDGEWVDSEEPIAFTAEGIEHFISLYPSTADDSIVPVRWYLDGDKENAVEFKDGDYSGILNQGRMPGGEHTLTVEFNRKYVDFTDWVTSYDSIQQDDSITDSITITFTANTFNFGEVSAILLTVFGMIADIFLLLFGTVGGNS